MGFTAWPGRGVWVAAMMVMRVADAVSTLTETGPCYFGLVKPFWQPQD